MTLSEAFALTAIVCFVTTLLLGMVDDGIAAFFAVLSGLAAFVTALAAVWTGYAA